MTKKGYKQTDAARKNMSKAHLGKNRKPFSKNHCKHISESKCGKKGTFYGEGFTQEMREAFVDCGRGEKNPMYGRCGENHPRYGKHHSDETRKEIGNAGRGSKCNFWKGGISFAPYCEKFNQEFRKRVRARYEYKCVECETTQEENGKALSVHHVHYDKKTCCKEGELVGNRKFVALCKSCHANTNNNREFWEDWYTEIINEFYGGICYLPK